jgi:hypothetical protein
MPAKRPCPRPGCPELIGKGERACPQHRAEVERVRGSKQARGYGPVHQAVRRRWARVIAQRSVLCARCGEPITVGMAWHLDHRDDRTGYLGPSHAGCNVSAAATRGGGGPRL